MNLKYPQLIIYTCKWSMPTAREIWKLVLRKQMDRKIAKI